MNNNTFISISSKSALRRLLIVLVITLGFVIYSYGWTVTQINLEKPKEPQRQENLTNALQELLSPRIFDQERTVVQIATNFRVQCDENSTLDQPEHAEDEAYVIVTPDCGVAGDIVTVEVFNFEPGADTRIRWIPPEGQSRPREVLETGREEILLDDRGDFKGQIEVPLIRGADGQVHQVAVRSAIPAGPVVVSDGTQLVIQRMVETIFMALVATSIAIPIAALISFFAARNLMRSIRLSLGNLLVAFIALVIGWLIGGVILTPLATFGVMLGKGDENGWLLALVVPLTVLMVFPMVTRSLGSLQLEGLAARGRAILSKLIWGLAIIFFFGAFGGLSMLIGSQLASFSDMIRPEVVKAAAQAGETALHLNPAEWGVNAFADGFLAVGNFLFILGELAELFAPVVASAVSGFLVMSVASDLLAVPLRLVPPLVSHVLGGVLGFVSGGVLMGMMGFLGLSAALLGLLPPIVAAILGGQIVVLVYENIFNTPRQPKHKFERDNVESTIRLTLFAVGAVGMFLLTFNALNIGLALVNGTLPQHTAAAFLGVDIPEYVLRNALIGAVLGAVGGALAGVQSNFPLGSTLYNVSRTALNTVRSIEPLIMGLVFVIWVGIGPFAGVLALTLHSIAALGKLYSEQIENIDPGPIEAIQSTGASWLQMVIYAVVPQIIPPYIAFTMYRWDINVRMSTIIGFVGGGGIGLLLQQQINLLRYRDAGVAVLAIAIVVSILDYASASIRERMT